MTTRIWRGDAPAVAQVVTATPANVEIGDTFRLTINGKSIAFIATVATVANVCAGIVAAWEAASIPEWDEVELESTGSLVRLTARSPGVPFEVSAAATNGGANDTQTFTAATITASSGPHHWSDASNWSPAGVPETGDTVYLEANSTAILYGLNQAAVTLAALHIAASFTGEIGLPRVNREGSQPYAEYRQRELAIGATLLEIGDNSAKGSGSGSGRLLLNTGSVQTAITVQATGVSLDQDLPALCWRGTHADNTLDLLDGHVGVAIEGGQTATLATLRQSAGTLRCGAGVTLSDIEHSGGSLSVCTSMDDFTQSGGETTVAGSAAADSMQLTGGRVAWQSSGTITSATIDGPDAVLDFSGDLRPRTVSSCALDRGMILDPHRTVTWTTGVQPASTVQGY